MLVKDLIMLNPDDVRRAYLVCCAVQRGVSCANVCVSFFVFFPLSCPLYLNTLEYILIYIYIYIYIYTCVYKLASYNLLTNQQGSLVENAPSMRPLFKLSADASLFEAIDYFQEGTFYVCGTILSRQPFIQLEETLMDVVPRPRP